MTTISDLPRDLVEEVLSRVPVTSMRAVRFTCTRWNILSTHESFTKKQIGQAKAAAATKKHTEESLVVMTMNFRAYLMSVDLHGIHKDDDNDESSVQPKGKLISLNDGDQVVEYKVLHCDGLLLCTTIDNSRLVVWNPYCGQTRWIEPRNCYNKRNNYALGYEMTNESHHRSHKILRYLHHETTKHKIRECEIYSFDSSSWKVVEVASEWYITSYQSGVSLKGNTYWNALDDIKEMEEERRREIGGDSPNFLICFDFTRERFGRRLPLPFHSGFEDIVTLSSVREEQLAVLVQRWSPYLAKIWISDKIEPDAVSWSKLLLEFPMQGIPSAAPSFFLDQKNRVAVVFGNGECVYHKPTRNIACIYGEDGHSKQLDLGESEHKYYFPYVCSYVPSPVQIKQSKQYVPYILTQQQVRNYNFVVR